MLLLFFKERVEPYLSKATEWVEGVAASIHEATGAWVALHFGSIFEACKQAASLRVAAAQDLLEQALGALGGGEVYAALPSAQASLSVLPQGLAVAAFALLVLRMRSQPGILVPACVMAAPVELLRVPPVPEPEEERAPLAPPAPLYKLPARPKKAELESPTWKLRCAARLALRGWTRDTNATDETWVGELALVSGERLIARFAWYSSSAQLLSRPRAPRWRLTIEGSVPDYLRAGFRGCWAEVQPDLWSVNHHHSGRKTEDLGDIERIVHELESYVAVQEVKAGLREEAA